ncbi:MAG TPA: hypothetical protein PLU53_09665 [Bacteroidia bacterium]|nr:hypothetical protein [Bacteroidia bacterium]
MKKMYVLFFAVLPCLALSAQDRTCATMSSLEDRMVKDPSLRQQHEDFEKITQEWIRTHSTPVAVSVFPSLQGFVPTGDREVDQQRYAAAKAAIIREKGKAKLASPVPSTTADQKTSVNKSKAKSVFVYGNEGGSK